MKRVKKSFIELLPDDLLQELINDTREDAFHDGGMDAAVGAGFIKVAEAELERRKASGFKR